MSLHKFDHACVRVLVASAIAGAMPIVVAVADPSPLWRVPGEGRGQPAAERDTVYFLSKRHEVLAVDAETGVVRWRRTTGEPGDATDGALVLLSDATVVVGDYNVIGFDKRTGQLRWKFSPSDGYAPGIYLGSIGAGAVFAGSPSGRVYAIDSNTGAVRWSTLVMEGGTSTMYQPVVERDIVASSYTSFTAPASGGVAVLDAASGRVRWRTPFPTPSNKALGTNTTGSLVVTDDSIIAPAGNGTITGFDRETGDVLWTIPKLENVPNALGPTEFDVRTVARVGNLLVAGSLFGVIVAYDLESRREMWRHDASSHGSVDVMMAADDRTVYVPFFGGRQVALDAKTGVERWGIGEFQSPFMWPALPYADRIYVSSPKAGFFAYRKNLDVAGANRR
jgi:outer membrane protein assembly factor BamB